MNECLNDNGGCQQRCEDTALAYNCRCGDGYTLSADERSCDGNNSNYGTVNIGAASPPVVPSLSKYQRDGDIERRDTLSIFSCSLDSTATLSSCYTQCLQREPPVGIYIYMHT